MSLAAAMHSFSMRGQSGCVTQPCPTGHGACPAGPCDCSSGFKEGLGEVVIVDGVVAGQQIGGHVANLGGHLAATLRACHVLCPRLVLVALVAHVPFCSVSGLSFGTKSVVVERSATGFLFRWSAPYLAELLEAAATAEAGRLSVDVPLQARTEGNMVADCGDCATIDSEMATRVRVVQLLPYI